MHADAQLTVVVFDLGNVLITWDRRLLFRSVFDDPAAMDRFLDEVYTLEVNDRLDRGTPLHEVCATLLRDHPQHGEAITALRDRWIETIGPVIDGTVDVLRELVARGVGCYALSNWNAETFALVAPHHDWLGLFRGIVLSGREGVAKPDAEIFRRLCVRYGIDASRALFVDDNAVNVDAARAFGMDAVRFTEPVAFRRALRERGLLP